MKKKNVKFTQETVSIETLRPHPRNYRLHPNDQLEHLKQSIKENGIYRNIVIAKDGTILAGHGVIEACRAMGIREVPSIRIEIEPNDPRAIRIVVGDNEIGHLCERDDRMLTNLLKELMNFGKKTDSEINQLLGTGFDEMMFKNLEFITRPPDSLNHDNPSNHWVGMPEYESPKNPLKIIVSFETEEDKLNFAKKLDIHLPEKCISIWYPPKEKDDIRSIKIQ